MHWKSLGISLIAAAALLALAGCEEDDTTTKEPQGTTSLTMQASNAAHTTGLQAMWRNLRRAAGFSEAYAIASGTDGGGNVLDLTDFQVAIEKIKFKSEDEDSAALDDDADVEFEGPYAVDLLDAAAPLAQALGDVEVPAGVYDGIRFVMHKSSELAATEPLFDRSIYIAGTFTPGGGTATPFVMWHDTGENFDLSGTNGFQVTEGQTGNDLIVDFKLQSLFTGINLSTCTTPLDINPGTAETNCRAIADTLKDNIKAAADFGKDDDGDGDVGEDEDVD